MHLNIEIKARCHNPKELLERLLSLGAVDHGVDHQIDTYFNVSDGRLKLRRGNIENSLIYYKRNDHAGPKDSQVYLEKLAADNSLDQVLAQAIGVKVVVDKKRRILFIENVKFHIDEVNGLGNFVEIEAIDQDGSLGRDKIEKQCHQFKAELQIDDKDLLENSYSDLIRQQLEHSRPEKS